MPKPEPVDAAMVVRANRFDATIFLGAGRGFHTESLTTLEAARARAAAMGAEFQSSRKGMVYAVTPEGRSTFVPANFQPTNVQENAMPITGLDTPANLADYKAGATAMVAATVAKRQAALQLAPAPAKKPASKPAKPAKAPKAKQPAKKPTSAKKTPAKPAAKVTAPKAVAPKPAKVEAPKAAPVAKAPKADQKLGQRAKAQADAERGVLPAAPDFSAETHKRFRPKLAEVVALAKAGDLKGLKAYAINPVSSSPKAIAKYRDLAVIALEAKAKAA